MALDGPDHRAADRPPALRNSALSESPPHGGRLRLGSSNSRPPLHGERELWTYH
jgi:hypothetical protein